MGSSAPQREQAAGRVLLTGATGYVGGRLLRKLEESGRPVRCMARRPEALSGRAAEQTEIVHGDVLEPDSLHEALAGVTAAYYLVHSMAASGPFAGADRRGAENFAAAARESGVSRIVYLGGLGAEHDVSTHLESRHEVGRILRESGVPTIEFRASIVIGSGSVSFEIVRSLVDRSPVLLIPRWVVSRTQPIAIEDVLAYLLAALDLELEESRLFEIGGPDRVAYADLMREYARQAGPPARRDSRPSRDAAHLRALVERRDPGVREHRPRAHRRACATTPLVRDGSAREVFPIRPRGFRQAIERALANEDREFAETRWSDALSAHAGRNWGGVTLRPAGRRIAHDQSRRVAGADVRADPADRRHDGLVLRKRLLAAARPHRQVVGGVGLRRGRRDPVRLAVGDTLDFWRVEAFEQDRLLRLAAEMKSPGTHLAAVRGRRRPTGIDTAPDRRSSIPTASQDSSYWYVLYPVHHLIFEGMLRRIGRAAIASGGTLAPRRRGQAEQNP